MRPGPKRMPCCRGRYFVDAVQRRPFCNDAGRHDYRHQPDEPPRRGNCTRKGPSGVTTGQRSRKQECSDNGDRSSSSSSMLGLSFFGKRPTRRYGSRARKAQLKPGECGCSGEQWNRDVCAHAIYRTWKSCLEVREGESVRPEQSTSDGAKTSCARRLVVLVIVCRSGQVCGDNAEVGREAEMER